VNRSLKSFCLGMILLLAMIGQTNGLAAAADAWSVEWEKTLAAAKKEGEISFYGSEGYEKIFGIFQKKYPEVKVKSNTNRRGNEHGSRHNRNVDLRRRSR